MGIGAAFAAGLIGGFTKNIEEERAKRLSDQEKVDQLNILMAEYAMKPADERSAAGVNAVRDMITSAQSQMEGRESINLIGSRSAGLDLDISKVKGIIDDVATGYKMIGGYKVPVPDDYKDDGKTSSSVVLFDAINQEFINNRQRFDAHFQQNPGDMIVFRDRVNNLAGDYISNRSTQNGINIRTIAPSDIAGFSDLSEYFGIGKTRQFNTEADTLISKVSEVSTDSVAPITSPVVLPGAFDPDSQGANMAVFDMSDLGITTPSQVKSIERMAQIQGMDSRRFLFEHAKNFEDLDSMQKGLAVSHELFLKGAGSKQSSLEQVIAQGDFLYNDPRLKDDPLMQAYAMAPFLPLTLTKKEQERIDMGQIVEDAFSKLSVANQFKELYGSMPSEFQSRYDAAKRARSKLRRYREIVGDKTTKSGSILESAYANVLAFFGETGTVDQVMNLMGLSEDDADYGKIKSRVKTAVNTDDKLIAQSGTLAFIIAADLARAEDSAGRLSDGDLLRNLQKLRGGDVNNTIQGQLAGIDEVINDVEKMYRGLTVTNNRYSTALSKNGFTREDRRFLAADRLARDARDSYLNERAILGEDNYSTPELEAPGSISTADMTPMISNSPASNTHRAGSYFQMNDKYYVVEPESETPIEVSADEAMSAFTAFKAANMGGGVPQTQQRDPAGSSIPSPADMQGAAATMKQPPAPLPAGSSVPSPDDMEGAAATMKQPPAPLPVGAIPGTRFAGQKRRTNPDGTVSFGNDSTKYRKVERGGKPFYLPLDV